MAALDEMRAALRAGLALACTPSGIGRILAGREQVLALPRTFVLENIEAESAALLDLDDEWEYRRLLELADLLEPALVQRLVARGLTSRNPEVVEAATDFQA